MAVNVRPGDRDQVFLLPPSMRDWLPEDHLAFFVLDVVAELDLTAFYRSYRADGRGGAVYDPVLMLAVLVYFGTTETFQRGFKNYLQSHGGFEETVKDLRKRFKFMGDSGSFIFLYVIGEPVPSYDDWCKSRGREHHGHD